MCEWDKLRWGQSFYLNADYMKLFLMMKIPTGAAKILIKFNFDLLLSIYFSNFFILISDLPNENISLGHYQLCIEVVGYRSATQTHLEEESWHWISKTGTRWFFFNIHGILSFESGEQLAWGFSPMGMWKCRPVSHTANLIAQVHP